MFEPLLGQPCWLVQRGHGSFVTLEFGEPRLTIHHPRPSSTTGSAGEPVDLMRRMVVVHGQWHLWVYCCHWTLDINRTRIASSESADELIDTGLEALNGQALAQVHLSDQGASRFDFDLGCQLVTRPWHDATSKEPVEQWLLYQPDGRVLALRDDGSYRNESGGTAPRADRLPQRP